MIDKNCIFDIAIVALMQHHGYACERSRDGSYKIRIPDEAFLVLCQRYQLDYHPVLQRIQRLRKDLQNLRHSAQTSPETEIQLDRTPKVPT